MKKLYRYLKFHIKTAWKNLVRNFGLAMSAAFSVTITLILISLFLLITNNLNNFTYNVEDQLTIRASIDNIVKDSDKEKLKQEIQNMNNVKTVTLSTGDEELAAYKEEYQSDNSLFEMYDGKTNPIMDTFIVEVKEGKGIELVAKNIKDVKGIVKADYGGEATKDLLSTFTSIRDGGFVCVIVLIILAVFLISNKIKMSIYTRKSEIAIMRFVGASNWCVKFPMMLEGIIIGFMGSIIPVLITIFAYQYFYRLMSGAVLSNMFQLKSVFPLTINISILLIGIGMFVGLIGSFFSTTRYLRWKR